MAEVSITLRSLTTHSEVNVFGVRVGLFGPKVFSVVLDSFDFDYALSSLGVSAGLRSLRARKGSVLRDIITVRYIDGQLPPEEFSYLTILPKKSGLYQAAVVLSM